MEVEGFNRNTTPCGSYGSSALDFVLGVEGEKHDAGREAVKRALAALGVNVNATNKGAANRAVDPVRLGNGSQRQAPSR